MRKTIVMILLAVGMALTNNTQAQTFGGPETMKGKTVVGGDIGIGLYGNTFHFGIAPQIGFRLTRSLEVGTRVGYDLLYCYNNYYYGNYFCHYFSGALYANYEIYRGIYVHVEDEEMCLLVRGKYLNSNAPTWYNSFFVGAGYRQYFSSTGYVYYSILYNLSWDYGYYGDNGSPYNSPFVIRMGYCFGF